MNRFTLAASLFAVSLSAPAFAANAPADIVAIEGNWAKAMANKDMAALKTIIAPDWHGQNASGKLTSRAEFLTGFASGKDVTKSMTNHDVHVRFAGGLAIAQGMDSEVSSHNGKSTSGEYSWTDVYEKRAGHWVAIASQVTKVDK